MKNNVVTITKNNVVLEILDSKAKDPVLMRDVVDWKAGHLGTALSGVLESAKTKKPIRLLLAEDFYYIAGFEVDEKLEDRRDEIKFLAEELIPEDLGKVGWDYGVINKEKGISSIQCFALTTSFDRELVSALKEYQFKIDAIEPYSLSIVKSFETNKPSFLLLYKDEIITLAMLVQNGLVVYSDYFDLEKADENLGALISHAKKQYGLKLTKLVLSGIKKSVVKKIPKAVKVVNVEIAANMNLVEKYPIKGKDSKVLNLQSDFAKNREIQEEDTSEKDEDSHAEDQGSGESLEPSQSSTVDSTQKPSVLAYIFLFVTAVLGVGLGVLLSSLF